MLPGQEGRSQIPELHLLHLAKGNEVSKSLEFIRGRGSTRTQVSSSPRPSGPLCDDQGDPEHIESENVGYW